MTVVHYGMKDLDIVSVLLYIDQYDNTDMIPTVILLLKRIERNYRPQYYYSIDILSQNATDFMQWHSLFYCNWPVGDVRITGGWAVDYNWTLLVVWLMIDSIDYLTTWPSDRYSGIVIDWRRLRPFDALFNDDDLIIDGANAWRTRHWLLTVVVLLFKPDCCGDNAIRDDGWQNLIPVTGGPEWLYCWYSYDDDIVGNYSRPVFGKGDIVRYWLYGGLPPWKLMDISGPFPMVFLILMVLIFWYYCYCVVTGHLLLPVLPMMTVIVFNTSDIDDDWPAPVPYLRRGCYYNYYSTSHCRLLFSNDDVIPLIPVLWLTDDIKWAWIVFWRYVIIIIQYSKAITNPDDIRIVCTRIIDGVCIIIIVDQLILYVIIILI